MFYDSEGNLKKVVDELNFDNVCLFIESTWGDKPVGESVIDALEFFTENKDKVYKVSYEYAFLKDFEEVSLTDNTIILRFKSASLMVPKPCVAVLFKTGELFDTYYGITGFGKMFEVILEK